LQGSEVARPVHSHNATKGDIAPRCGHSFSKGRLGTALGFARHSHAVIPIWWPVERDGRLRCACGKEGCTSPGKHPVARFNGRFVATRGLLDATTEPGLIKDWYRWIPDANVGVSTANLVVLDIDVRHDGLEWLHALEREHCKTAADLAACTSCSGARKGWNCARRSSPRIS
jgi:hypothetical protein